MRPRLRLRRSVDLVRAVRGDLMRDAESLEPPRSGSNRRLTIQLWSYNFDPEPTGIGIVSTAWARGQRDLGHQVEVVAAHPHYPEPRWGTRLMPYREIRDGIDVLRLPRLDRT